MGFAPRRRTDQSSSAQRCIDAPRGGACQVCCQMWRVRVRYTRSGRADVSVERADESSYE